MKQFRLPSTKRLKFALVTCISVLGFSGQLLASTYEDYEKALNAFNEKHYEQSFIHLKNSLKKDPDNLTAKILMGRLLLQNGYVGAAELEFRESLDMGADINLVAEPLGTAWLFQNRFTDIVAFEEYKRLGAEQKSAWLKIRATACTKLDDAICAQQAYEDMLELPYHRDVAYNGLAAVAMSADDIDQAERLLERAEAENPENPVLWRLRGQLAYRQQNLEQAIAYFKRSLAINASDPISLRNLVNIYLAQNDFDSARTYVDEIMARTPEDPLAILLNNWLMTHEQRVVTNQQEMQGLSNSLSELSPDVVESQPLLLYISGLTAYFNDNIEKAAGDFERYLNKRPDDLQAIKLLAKTYISTQRSKLALSLLEKKQSLLVSDLNSALLLGDLLIEENKNFKADRLVKQLESLYPNTLGLELFKIKLLTVRGKVDMAMALLDEIYARQQLNPTFLFTYATIKIRFQQLDDAVKAADALIAIFPEKPDVYNLKAGILLQQQENDKARALLNKALELKPTMFAARFNLASLDSKEGDITASDELLTQLLADVPRHVPSQLLSAQNFIVKGDIESASTIYNNVLVLTPDNQEARLKLVQISAAKGDMPGALYQLDKLLKNDFDNPAYLLQKANLLVSMEQPDKALQALKLAKDAVTGNAKMQEDYAEILLKLSRPEEALAMYQQARILSPHDNTLVLQTAKLQIALGDSVAAAKTIASSINKNQNNPDFWYVAGLLAESRSNYPKAAQAYQKSVSLSPDFAQPLLASYKLAQRGNQVEGFIDMSSDLMRQHPNYLLPANLLAQFFYERGEFAKARPIYGELVKFPNVLNKSIVLGRLAEMSISDDINQASVWIKEAYTLNSSDPDILDTYGWVLANAGEYSQSLEMLRQSFSRQATNPTLRYHLGYTLLKMGKETEAKEHLRAAIDSQEDFRERAAAEGLYQSL